MESNSPSDELLALVQDAGEYVSYMRELGVEAVEDAEVAALLMESQAPRGQSATLAAGPPTSKNYGALQRNAAAAPKPESPPAATRQSTASVEVARTVTDQTAMAKRKTKATPELEQPPPQETLFGEVTPKDEASLPRADETLEDIRNDIGECVRCPLHQGRTHVVNSEGNPKARLMFVGEAPGADEDAQARPFVGRAGQLLNKIIQAIGMKREEVFIGNVNRCRPPQNRPPTAPEAKTCKPFLIREVAIVRPEVIVVLGNTAMQNLLDTKERIGNLRGKFQDYKGIKVMPTFHPAYLLRDPSKKREAWDDMKKVRDYLDGKLKV